MKRHTKILFSWLLAPLMLFSCTVCIGAESNRPTLIYHEDFESYQAISSHIDLDSEVRFFGRTYKQNGAYYFNWSSSGFTFSFQGSGAKATILSNAPGGRHTAYIKIYVDGVWQKDIALTKASQEIVLAKDLDPSVEHTVKVVKRTNARSSTADVATLTLTDGMIKAPAAASDKLIEFIGDSLTVGYATVAGNATAWSTATEDSTQTYSEQIADYFGADYMVTAISGRGIVRNTSGDTDKLLPAIYPKLDAYNNPSALYDFAAQPDVIVINLGTNDAGSANADLTAAEFRAGLKQFLKDVRKYNPNAEILYTYGLLTTKYATDMQAVINELRAEGDQKITYMNLETCSSSERVLGHTTKEAYVSRGEAIIEKLAELTKWEKAEVNTPTPPVNNIPSETLPEETTAPESPSGDTDAETDPQPAKDEGCDSGISAGTAALALLGTIGALATKKKKATPKK